MGRRADWRCGVIFTFKAERTAAGPAVVVRRDGEAMFSLVTPHEGRVPWVWLGTGPRLRTHGSMTRAKRFARHLNYCASKENK